MDELRAALRDELAAGAAARVVGGVVAAAARGDIRAVELFLRLLEICAEDAPQPLTWDDKVDILRRLVDYTAPGVYDGQRQNRG